MVQLTGSNRYSANKSVEENKKNIRTKKNFFIKQIIKNVNKILSDSTLIRINYQQLFVSI